MLKKIKLAYKNMKDRCYNPKNPSYMHYGYKGILVCDEWLVNQNNFIEWCLDKEILLNYSIDRINNEGNYSPNNCRWTDTKTQNRNRSSNTFINYKGQTKSIVEWSEEFNIPEDTICKRLYKYNKQLDDVFSKEDLNKAAPLIHGTRQGYERYKCRCVDCKKFNAKRAFDRRKKVDACGYLALMERCQEA